MTLVAVVCKPCIRCHKAEEVTVDAGSLVFWKMGALIQDAFPELSPADRELLMTGIHPGCFQEIFAEEEE